MKWLLITLLILGGSALGAVALVHYAWLDDAVEEKPLAKLTLINKKISKDQLQRVHAAVKVFQESCPELIGLWDKVVRAEVAYSEKNIPEEYDYRTKNYGWKKEVQLNVSILDNPSKLPPKYGNAAGHTLWYYLGGGDKPGIIAMKLQSAQLCPMDMPDPSRDAFLPVAEMAVIDK